LSAGIWDLIVGIEELGAWGPVAFIAAYVVATVAFLPGALLTLVAGAIFGLWRGVAIVFTGAVLGSSAAFAIARRLARRRVARWLERDPRTAAIGAAVGARGRTVVLLLRLSPVFPYNALNYALGLSPVRYRDFLIGSVGMLPGTFLYTYYGKVIGDVAAVAAGVGPRRGPEYYAFLAVGLAATIAVTLIITRAAQAALRAAGAERQVDR
jgi:uncharacterized membrane protein YdjX (TVP38/TMEM64 family)